MQGHSVEVVWGTVKVEGTVNSSSQTELRVFGEGGHLAQSRLQEGPGLPTGCLIPAWQIWVSASQGPPEPPLTRPVHPQVPVLMTPPPPPFPPPPLSAARLSLEDRSRGGSGLRSHTAAATLSPSWPGQHNQPVPSEQMARTVLPQITTSALAAPEVRPSPQHPHLPRPPANPSHLTVLPEWPGCSSKSRCPTCHQPRPLNLIFELTDACALFGSCDHSTEQQPGTCPSSGPGPAPLPCCSFLGPRGPNRSWWDWGCSPVLGLSTRALAAHEAGSAVWASAVAPATPQPALGNLLSAIAEVGGPGSCWRPADPPVLPGFLSWEWDAGMAGGPHCLSSRGAWGAESAVGDSPDGLAALQLDGVPSGDLDGLVPTRDERGRPIPEWKRQVMVRKLQARLGADRAREAQDDSGSPGLLEQAAWRYSQAHQAVLGPFGELLTEDDLVYLEKQIEDLQLRRRCQEYESELGRLAAELQALLPEPLVSITVNSHFLPRAPGLEEDQALALVAEPTDSAETGEAVPGGQPLPFWCSHISRLVRSMSLLLKGVNGLVQSEESATQALQDPRGGAAVRPPRSEAQREIQEFGVSVRVLRGNFELAPGQPCASDLSPCELAAQPGQCLRGCCPAPLQPRASTTGGGPGPGDTEEASDSGISCEEAPSEAGAVPSLDSASLRKERIVMLFLSHWKKSAYTPALKTAACRTLEARKAGPRGQEVARSPRAPSLLPSEDPRLGHLWPQRSIITQLLGNWKAIMAHVPARQLRRLSRRPRSPLSPEQFLPHVNGAPVPYSSLPLDLFMLGYFQLLECDLPAEERKMRHLLCFEVFEHLGAHGWEAVRAFHKAVTDEVAAGRRTWTDGFEDIKARFFGSSQGATRDTEPGRKSGLTPLGPLPSATIPSSGPESPAQRLGFGSQRGSFNSEDICGYIDRSFAFWKEKEAEMFNFE
ncbi:Hypothetical predicted protein [Marmota monax]|uniref:Espin-like protein n=1 Tax=Marmota monax TaxID=9995 RepID=A0A5E4C9E8_MARMO|nr:Hypothetical predicted protein [Marmota monax]